MENEPKVEKEKEYLIASRLEVFSIEKLPEGRYAMPEYLVKLSDCNSEITMQIVVSFLGVKKYQVGERYNVDLFL